MIIGREKLFLCFCLGKHWNLCSFCIPFSFFFFWVPEFIFSYAFVMSTNKIPRIELTRERSSTMESIQSLTRGIRESLRLHNIRREKKRRQKKSSGQKGDTNLLDVKDTKRARSKSMDHNIDNDEDSCNEISEV